LEDLKSRRDELLRQLQAEQDEKVKIQNDLHILTERLGRVTESLARKQVLCFEEVTDYDDFSFSFLHLPTQASLEEFNSTIRETESAYGKVSGVPWTAYTCGGAH
jgi:hypothetical protein